MKYCLLAKKHAVIQCAKLEVKVRIFCVLVHCQLQYAVVWSPAKRSLESTVGITDWVGNTPPPPTALVEKNLHTHQTIGWVGPTASLDVLDSNPGSRSVKPSYTSPTVLPPGTETRQVRLKKYSLNRKGACGQTDRHYKAMVACFICFANTPDNKGLFVRKMIMGRHCGLMLW